MEDEDDTDLKLLRASDAAIAEIKAITKQLLGHSAFTKFDGHADVSKINHLLDLFQEDPQLLDAHLKALVPPLVTRYVQEVQKSFLSGDYESTSELRRQISKVVNFYCKVRGDKVISNFLNNEPKHVEAILAAAKQLHKSEGEKVLRLNKDALSSNSQEPDWQQSYVLLLWLSHLMLTPFDLESVSGTKSLDNSKTDDDLEISTFMPRIAREIVHVALYSLGSATKAQKPAAKLLVRLAWRHDMRRAGLADSLVQWMLKKFESVQDDMEIYPHLGYLTFLAGLVAASEQHDLDTFLMDIYLSSVQFTGSNNANYQQLQSSAAAKKLSVKLQRNLVQYCLRFPNPKKDTGELIEGVLDFLLLSLADRDTQVRLIASKSISAIASNLESEMAQDIVDAVIGGLREDNFDELNFSRVNPLRWHGLTLTLSHLLFRRTPSPAQLRVILEALFKSLAFEQRSTTGSSVGGNVRDAANFGLWSLARRYSTKELIGIDSSMSKFDSVLIMSANQLVAAACLDPIGNVRRGSSAALQELIGRHPNTINQGISLVQIVDYQSVGLRSRAMCEVSLNAAKLDNIYRNTLVEALYGWRGVRAPDRASRNHAAVAIGGLSALYSQDETSALILNHVTQMSRLQPRDIEGYHGFMVALASILKEHALTIAKISRSKTDQQGQNPQGKQIGPTFIQWSLFDDQIRSWYETLKSASSRPYLSAEGIISVSGSIADCVMIEQKCDPSFINPPTETVLEVLFPCLKHVDESFLDATVSACESISQLLSPSRRIKLLRDLTMDLHHASSNSAMAGIAMALASVLGTSLFLDLEIESESRRTALDTLIQRSSPPLNIEARSYAIRSLKIVVHWLGKCKMNRIIDHVPPIVDALTSALNDYTINERGDVGSLVRTEALGAIRTARESKVITSSFGTHACAMSVQRLALERLDKVRLQAAQCVGPHITYSNLKVARRHTNLADVSTYEYYRDTLLYLLTSPLTLEDTAMREAYHLATLEGISSAAGFGAESIMQISRTALVDVLDAFPVQSTERSAETTLLVLGDALIVLLARSITNERVLVPLLETLAFLLDAGALDRLQDSAFRWRALLSLVQKAHFKSSNISKLLASVQIYRGLADVAQVRAPTVAKLVGMLAHPFPKIRVAVAEVLLLVTKDARLKPLDWSRPAQQHRSFVEAFRKRHEDMTTDKN